LTTLLQTLKGKTIAQVREDGLLDNTSLSILETNNGKSFQEKCWNYIAY
jgi:broad specificity phosphatase PhoE